jgi:uncharacterized protein (TIGR02118 family)
MVKLFAVLKRKDGMTHDEFVDHWLNEHGPLIADTPALARHIVRYEQHVRHRPDALSGDQRFDGVTVQWFDSMDGFVGFMSEPEYGELIHPDEERFLDMDELVFIVTEEPVVPIDGAVGGER